MLGYIKSLYNRATNGPNNKSIPSSLTDTTGGMGFGAVKQNNTQKSPYTQKLGSQFPKHWYDQNSRSQQTKAYAFNGADYYAKNPTYITDEFKNNYYSQGLHSINSQFDKNSDELNSQFARNGLQGQGVSEAANRNLGAERSKAIADFMTSSQQQFAQEAWNQGYNFWRDITNDNNFMQQMKLSHMTLGAQLAQLNAQKEAQQEAAKWAPFSALASAAGGLFGGLTKSSA